MLEDLKVVEFSTYVAGPRAAMVMADWGAQVVKIEGRGGEAGYETSEIERLLADGTAA